MFTQCDVRVVQVISEHKLTTLKNGDLGMPGIFMTAQKGGRLGLFRVMDFSWKWVPRNGHVVNTVAGQEAMLAAGEIRTWNLDDFQTEVKSNQLFDLGSAPQNLSSKQFFSAY